ncbi:beta-1,3-glucan-binding protein-like [Chironomus tepperi]|uniref:beta-1,3-glucan-binding protein-like n=1 Tax=Chironomus tepperi TaxID=113505 RepID=UPI00391F87D1
MKILALGLIFYIINSSNGCDPTVTAASGSLAPTTICSRDLIFEDNFDGETVDQNKWLFDNTLWGGGNKEFQWYPGYDKDNAFIKDGILRFVPTTTAEKFGEEFLYTAHVVIPPEECTIGYDNGCEKQGTEDYIINPIRSTRIDSRYAFRYKYGELEIRAKLPTGDWLWPALWGMPFYDTYGGWPSCGEIDLMEGRGNRELYDGDVNTGIHQIGSTMHFGPDAGHNGWPTAHATISQVPAFSDGFHRYRLRWTPTDITYFVDNKHINTVKAGEGFWKRGGWENSGLDNPYVNGTVMAPFDHEFYIIMNLAVGGTAYFPDHWVNKPYPKPWENSSGTAAKEFWKARHLWEPTWNRNTNSSHMMIDYVRVWAL